MYHIYIYIYTHIESERKRGRSWKLVGRHGQVALAITWL